jgi:hypothetical protein
MRGPHTIASGSARREPLPRASTPAAGASPWCSTPPETGGDLLDLDRRDGDAGRPTTLVSSFRGLRLVISTRRAILGS